MIRDSLDEQMHPNISIIIPSYNRVEVLRRTLKAIDRQNFELEDVEVLVMDDASSDDYGELVKEISNSAKFLLRYFRNNKNIGQGLTRNKAIDLAEGEYVFFIGDDTVPNFDFLKEHMRIHENNSDVAVLGKVVWADEVRNKFMNFIEPIQFHYQTIRDPSNVSLHFYTSNISLNSTWLKEERYSSAFKNYGFEDLELGYRLEKNGLRVIYNPDAIVHHVHSYDLDSFCERMYRTGLSAPIFASLHPEIKRRYIPLGWKIVKHITSIFARYPIIGVRAYWYARIVNQYLQGVERSMSQEDK